MCDLLVKPLCCIASAMDYVLERGVGGSKGGVRPRSGSSNSHSLNSISRRKKESRNQKQGEKTTAPDHERYYYQRQRLIRQQQSRTMTSATTYTGTDDDGLFDDLSEPDSWIGDEIDIDFMNPTMVDDEETMTSNSASFLSREESRRAAAGRGENEESDSEFMYVEDEDNYAYDVNTDYDTRQDSTLLPGNSSSMMYNSTLQADGGEDKYEDDTAFESRGDDEEDHSLLNITRSNHDDDDDDVVVRMMEQQARNEMKRSDFNRTERLRIQEQRKRELEAEMFEDTVSKDTEDFFLEFFSNDQCKRKSDVIGDQVCANDDKRHFGDDGDDSKTHISTKADKSVASTADKSLLGGGNSITSHSSTTKALPAQ